MDIFCWKQDRVGQGQGRLGSTLDPSPGQGRERLDRKRQSTRIHREQHKTGPHTQILVLWETPWSRDSQRVTLSGQPLFHSQSWIRFPLSGKLDLVLGKTRLARGQASRLTAWMCDVGVRDEYVHARQEDVTGYKGGPSTPGQDVTRWKGARSTPGHGTTRCHKISSLLQRHLVI